MVSNLCHCSHMHILSAILLVLHFGSCSFNRCVMPTSFTIYSIKAGSLLPYFCLKQYFQPASPKPIATFQNVKASITVMIFIFLSVPLHLYVSKIATSSIDHFNGPGHLAILYFLRENIGALQQNGNVDAYCLSSLPQ